MKVSYRKKDLFYFLLVLTYLLRAITDAVYVSREIDSIWTVTKYGTLLLAIMYGLCYLFSRGCKWTCLNVLWSITACFFVFFLISLFKMIYSGCFSVAILKQAVYMILPAITTVIAINIGDADDIYNFFCWILCITFFIYCVFEIGLEMFTKENFEIISMDESLSPFESHYTSATAMALCAYFSFDRRKKSMTLLSLAFSLLTFKRVFVICSLVLFFLPLVVNVRQRINLHIHNLCGVGICVITIGYFWCLIPENHEIIERVLGIESIFSFTSGRSEFFEKVYTDPFFVDFGWGSCEASLGRLLEMDLIQMLFEVSVVGLAVFVFVYWRIAGTTIYGMIYMGFHFLNMLTSHCIANAFVWVIVLISLVQIDNTSQNSQKKRFRFIC